MERKVLIMLSTYNGQKYIREQLDSLYAQKDVNFHLLVRDDGSKDDTINILKEYQQEYGKMIIHADENIGVAKSFHKLMAYAYEEFPDYDFYAFSDQDDVWLENKLSVAVNQLTDKNGEIYYCNAFVTDANLNKVSELGCEHNLSFQYSMFRQPALGCTQVMTNSFFKLCTSTFNKYLKENPPYIYLHDAWTMWISQMVGANVVVNDDCYIMYRQHSNNVTSHKTETTLQKMKRVSKRIRMRKGDALANFQILGKLLSRKLTPSASDALNRLYGYKNSIFHTLCFAIYMQNFFKPLSIKAMVIYRIICRLY